MHLLKTRLAAACLALFTVLPAQAEPVVAKHVAKDAKWYVHLDFAAAKKTVLYNTVIEAVRAQFPLDDTLAQVKQFLGVDPLTDIGGLTVYNNSFEKDAAAILIHSNMASEPIRAALAQNGDYKETPYNKHTILSWTDNNDGKHKVGCFYGQGVVLMADKQATLQMAIDVLDGTKPAESPLVKAPAAGAFLYGSADLASSDDKNVSQLLSNSEAATASVTEVDGQATLGVNLTARSAETGAQIRKILDGVIAFGALAASREAPTAGELIKQVKLTSEGTRISASFTHDSKTILQTLQKLDAEKKAKPAAKDPAVGEKPQGL